MFHWKHSVFAVYLLEDTSKPKDLEFEVVAFGSGTQWEKRITKDSKVKLEDIIWDSHAEVIANQSFRRYLISQMKKVYNSDTKESKESIFEYDHSSSSSTNTVPSSPSPCLKLRSNFRIHLYISKVPCGVAAHCLNAEKYTSAIWGQKCGEIKEQEHSTCYVIKSCTDKIASWINGGVQGAILHPYIGKIQIDTITIFSENHFSEEFEVNARAELLKYANTDTETKIIFTRQNRNVEVLPNKSLVLAKHPCNTGHGVLSINWWKDEEVDHFDTRRINDLKHDPSRICMSKMYEALYDCLGLNISIDKSRHAINNIKTNGLGDILSDFDKLEIKSANQSQTQASFDDLD